MISKILLSIFVVAVVMFSSVDTYAQPIPPTPIDNPNDPADVPIDGGLSILLAAGVGYGAKKINDQRKKKLADNSEK